MTLVQVNDQQHAGDALLIRLRIYMGCACVAQNIMIRCGQHPQRWTIWCLQGYFIINVM